MACMMFSEQLADDKLSIFYFFAVSEVNFF